MKGIHFVRLQNTVKTHNSLHIPKWRQLCLWPMMSCGLAENFCLFKEMSPEKEVETFVMATFINTNQTAFTYN
jgi:hypothetical protein